MIEIRRAATEDWHDIWPIFSAVVAAGDTYTIDPAIDHAAARALWLAAPPAQAWLARDTDTAETLGTYLLKPNQGGNGAHVANAGFMVSSAARGRGVGRAMAEHCLATATESGYAAMQFNAVVATNTHAIALWHSLGFDVVGTVPAAFRHPRDGSVDLLVMYRRLP